MTVTGFLWQIRYGNPYREPPNGQRVLAEMFVLSDGHSDAKCPAEIAEFQKPCGYTVAVTHVSPPTKSLSPETRARIRLGISNRDTAREAAIADERELYERMLRDHGRLLITPATSSAISAI